MTTSFYVLIKNHATLWKRLPKLLTRLKKAGQADKLCQLTTLPTFPRVVVKELDDGDRVEVRSVYRLVKSVPKAVKQAMDQDASFITNKSKLLRIPHREYPGGYFSGQRVGINAGRSESFNANSQGMVCWWEYWKPSQLMTALNKLDLIPVLRDDLHFTIVTAKDLTPLEPIISISLESSTKPKSSLNRVLIINDETS